MALLKRAILKQLDWVELENTGHLVVNLVAFDEDVIGAAAAVAVVAFVVAVAAFVVDAAVAFVAVDVVDVVVVAFVVVDAAVAAFAAAFVFVVAYFHYTFQLLLHPLAFLAKANVFAAYDAFVDCASVVASIVN